MSKKLTCSSHPPPQQLISSKDKLAFKLNYIKKKQTRIIKKASV